MSELEVQESEQELTSQGYQIMTLAETAELLRLTEKSVWQLAKDGHLPHFRTNGVEAGRYRFFRDQILDWARKQTQRSTRKGGAK